MTYCLAIRVDEGLVFMSDSRTNAGVDQISTHSKMYRFGGEGDRTLTLLSSGNLATCQSVVSKIRRDIRIGAKINLLNVEDLQVAAEYVGEMSIEEQEKHRVLRTDTTSEEFLPEANFILGGQIRGERPHIEHIYPQGNFVRASNSTPYLQIGEVKYGKPILDRIITRQTTLDASLKCALVSMDSSMRSNATVGPPVEYHVYRADTFSRGTHNVLEEDDEYLLGLRRAWAENIRTAFENLPSAPLAVEESPRLTVPRSLS